MAYGRVSGGVAQEKGRYIMANTKYVEIPTLGEERGPHGEFKCPVCGKCAVDKCDEYEGHDGYYEEYACSNCGQELTFVSELVPKFWRYIKPENRIVPESYERDVRELKALFAPFAKRLVELGYRLVIDADGEYMPTVLPEGVDFCPEVIGHYETMDKTRVSATDVLDRTQELCDRADLVKIARGGCPIAEIPKE